MTGSPGLRRGALTRRVTLHSTPKTCPCVWHAQAESAGMDGAGAPSFGVHPEGGGRILRRKTSQVSQPLHTTSFPHPGRAGRSFAKAHRLWRKVDLPEVIWHALPPVIWHPLPPG